MHAEVIFIAALAGANLQCGHCLPYSLKLWMNRLPQKKTVNARTTLKIIISQRLSFICEQHG